MAYYRLGYLHFDIVKGLLERGVEFSINLDPNEPVMIIEVAGRLRAEERYVLEQSASDNDVKLRIMERD